MLALAVFFLIFGVVCFCAASYFSFEIQDKDWEHTRLGTKLSKKVEHIFELKCENKDLKKKLSTTIGDLDALIYEYDQAVGGKYNHPETGKFVSREDFYKAVFDA